MIRAPIVLTLCLLLHALLPMALAAQPATIPDLLWEDPRQAFPIWLSMDVALTDEGQPADPWPPRWQRELEALRDVLAVQAERGPGCHDAVSKTVWEAPETVHLDWLTTHADAVFIARVTERAVGFHFLQTPGTLLRVEPVDMLRGKAPGKPVYVFMAAGETDFRGRRVCWRDSRYPALPGDDDHLLVFAFLTWPPENGLIYTHYGFGVATLGSDGSISLSPKLAGVGDGGIDRRQATSLAFVNRVRDLLAGSQGRNEE